MDWDGPGLQRHHGACPRAADRGPEGAALRPGHESPLLPVGDAHAAPGVAHLLVVNDGIVDLDPEPKNLRR